MLMETVFDQNDDLAEIIGELEADGIVCPKEQAEIVNELLHAWHNSPTLKADILDNGHEDLYYTNEVLFTEQLSDSGIDALASFYTHLMIVINLVDRLPDIVILKYDGEYAFLREADLSPTYIKPKQRTYDLSNFQTGTYPVHVH